MSSEPRAQTNINLLTPDSIPDLRSLEDEPVHYLAEEFIEAGAITLLAGEPKAGKSHLALRMAVDIALGAPFLGFPTSQVPVIYLDRENPLHTAKLRHSLFTGGQEVRSLKVWGRWLREIGLPPLIGSPLWLDWAKRHQPLFVFDSLVRFKGKADENSATEMAIVMEHLRTLADAGATVLLIHHRAKNEGSKYRGSSDIFAAVDCLLTLERIEDGLLRLTREATRNGADRTFTIHANYETGRYDLADSPAHMERRDRVAEIRQLVTTRPGITQNKIIETLGIGRTECGRLLRLFEGKEWRSEDGPRNSNRYFPLTSTPVSVPVCTTGLVTSTPVSPLIGETGSTSRTDQWGN